MKRLMLGFIVFIHESLGFCVMRLVLVFNNNAKLKKDASMWLNEHYKRKALKALLEATKFDVKCWQYGALMTYIDSSKTNQSCAKNAENAQALYKSAKG